MRLREIRTDRKLTQPQVVNSLKAVDKRVDVALYSKIETGLCLPTPPLLDTLLDILQARCCEVYSPEELRFPDTDPAAPVAEKKTVDRQGIQAPRNDRHRNRHRFVFRVSDETFEKLPKMLDALGYCSVQGWFQDCYCQVCDRYAQEGGDRL